MNRKLIVQIALPIFIESALMMVDSIIHIIWIGRLLGGLSVAAVGSCFPVIMALAAIANSSAKATSTPILQFYGAENDEELHKSINVSWSVALLVIAIVTAGGYVAAKGALVLLGTPSEILTQAVGYLRIMILGFVVMYLSFLTVSLLRGVGKAMGKAIFIIISAIGNLVLVPLFIVGAGPLPRMELYGAALASLIVSVIAVLSSLAFIAVRHKKLLTMPTGLRLKGKSITALLPAGMPVFIQLFTLALGYACIIIFVNPFGSQATAAYYIISRVDSIAALPMIAVMTAVSIIFRKNLSTGKSAEFKNIFKWGVAVGLPLILTIALLSFFAPEFIMQLFINQDEIMSMGADYLRIVSGGYILFILLYVCNGIIIGAGKAAVTTLFSLASLLVVRVPVAAILKQTGYGLTGVWIAVMTSFVILTACSLFYCLSGAWKKKPGFKKVESVGAAES